MLDITIEHERYAENVINSLYFRQKPVPSVALYQICIMYEKTRNKVHQKQFGLINFMLNFNKRNCIV